MSFNIDIGIIYMQVFDLSTINYNKYADVR